MACMTRNEHERQAWLDLAPHGCNWFRFLQVRNYPSQTRVGSPKQRSGVGLSSGIRAAGPQPIEQQCFRPSRTCEFP